MIAVDTSALMPIVLDEPMSADCKAALEAADDILISAGTMAEALIVADRRGVGQEVSRLIDALTFQVVAGTAASARRIARIYACWGRGSNTVGLNLGDCFAYEVAQQHGCPLLYVGDDFAKTEIVAAI